MMKAANVYSLLNFPPGGPGALTFDDIIGTYPTSRRSGMTTEQMCNLLRIALLQIALLQIRIEVWYPIKTLI